MAQNNVNKPIVGAIRWDAWIGNKGQVGQAVQTSLGPVKWHSRLPFYAKVISDSIVYIDGTSTSVMDKELYYARYAGINYWAFVTYPEADPMSLSLNNYLRSKSKQGIHFCMITETQRWGNSENYGVNLKRYADLACNQSAQKVLSGRPLLFLLGDDTGIIKVWKSLNAYKKVLEQYRQTVLSKGVKNPYIVFMGGNKADIDSLGIDAISAYNTADWSVKTTMPYKDLSEHTQQTWNTWKINGAPCVPAIMMGTDRRPRVEHPVFWESTDMHNHPVAYWQPNAKELNAHMNSAFIWMKLNKPITKANTVIIYAWNEMDEGGWIVPTLNKTGAIDTKRINILRQVLVKNK